MISVIIPVYNAEKTLANCWDSVLSQDYKDIEIRTETTQKYITEKTYYNLFGVDDGDNELLGSIQIIPNKITIDENDIVEYITTHLTSNKDMN